MQGADWSDGFWGEGVGVGVAGGGYFVCKAGEGRAELGVGGGRYKREAQEVRERWFGRFGRHGRAELKWVEL